jgi:hypothetical protein
MPLFDRYAALDWSARNRPSPVKPSADAIWLAEKAGDGPVADFYWQTRQACVDHLADRLIKLVHQRQRVLIGCDFCFGFPAGFADALGLPSEMPAWRETWEMLAALIKDGPDNGNNRFAVAGILNSHCMANTKDPDPTGPFWGCPRGMKISHLHATSPSYPFPTKRHIFLAKKRLSEQRYPKAQPAWKLLGQASVGGQTLTGIPALYRLRFNPDLAPYSVVWPFETGFHPPKAPFGQPLIVYVEAWPGMLPAPNRANLIKDQQQVRAMATWLAKADLDGSLTTLFGPPRGISAREQDVCCMEEGWIFGA